MSTGNALQIDACALAQALTVEVILIVMLFYTYAPENPCMTRGVTTSLCLRVSCSLTPSSISMLSHSVTPMAYRSLSTFAEAILP